jgi:hypothetical protein
MKKIASLFLVLVLYFPANSHGVGTGTPTPHPSAMLEITGVKGLLIPRLTDTQMNDPGLDPAGGLFDLQYKST